MSSANDEFGDLSSALGEAIKEEQSNHQALGEPIVDSPVDQPLTNKAEFTTDNPYVGLTFEDDTRQSSEIHSAAHNTIENVSLRLQSESSSTVSTPPQSNTLNTSAMAELSFELETPQNNPNEVSAPAPSGGAFGKSNPNNQTQTKPEFTTQTGVQSPFMKGVEVNIGNSPEKNNFEVVQYDSNNAIIGGLLYATIGSVIWCVLFCVTLGFFSILTRMLIAYFAAKGVKWGFKNGFTPEARNIAIGTCIFGLLLGNLLVSFTTVKLMDKLASVAIEEIENNPDAYETEDYQGYEEYEASDYSSDEYEDFEYASEEFDANEVRAEYDEMRNEFTVMSIFQEMTLDFRFLISLFIACSFAANKVWDKDKV